MTSKLEIYNLALSNLGEAEISSLSEAREPRRVLDRYYDGTVAYCLERGFWNWAMRSVMLDSSASDAPSFGFTNAFVKPTDWVRTYVISASESFENPLLRYQDEGGLWYADCDPMYIRYVSNDASWGMDLSLWPESFADYVSWRLALRAAKRVTGDNPSDDMKREEMRSMAFAKSKDAMDDPPGFPPTGTWVQSRGGHSSSMRSRWNGQTS
jgi:hypothetical protein